MNHPITNLDDIRRKIAEVKNEGDGERRRAVIIGLLNEIADMFDKLRLVAVGDRDLELDANFMSSLSSLVETYRTQGTEEAFILAWRMAHHKYAFIQ